MFKDRIDAGKQLVNALQNLKLKDPLILAIPRGGVVIGYKIAKALHAKLDIIVPRKLRAPAEPEVAIGAVMPDASTFLHRSAIQMLGITDEYIEEEKKLQMKESDRMLRTYRDKRPYPQILNKTVIIVDDGVATGATLIVALRWIKNQKAKRVIAAIPVAPLEVLALIRFEADEVVCLNAPEPFYAVGQFYKDFEPVEDNEVIKILNDYWSKSKQ